MKHVGSGVMVDSLVVFLKNSFQKTGFTRAIVGVSGGIDSAVSLTLAVKALGRENVLPVLLPYGALNPQGVVDATLVIQWLDIPQGQVIRKDIQSLVDSVIAIDPDMDNARRGNVMARMRMIVLFDQAKKHKALVVGTENKSEHLLGYFTRYGDEASDIEPLRNLYKTQVYELAKYLGIPGPIIIKKPTAGLWEGQTDEGEFGFSYKEADEILSLVYDGKMTIDEAIRKTGFSQEIVQRVVSRVTANDFKHHLPIIPTPKV